MTVKELIEILSKFDQDITVTYYNEYAYSSEVTEVSLEYCDVKQRLQLDLM